MFKKDAFATMALNKTQLEKFRKILEEKRRILFDAAQKTLESEMILSPDDRFDEVDQASSEYMQAFSFRLRGRERFLMDKIELALRKIDEGTFGICEECDEPISQKRLAARPEAPLCIQCKEAQEKEEAVYAD
ncbi:MAG: TraR/DksA C4-type zinc finger protein [Nannocystaceae bacterium]